MRQPKILTTLKTYDRQTFVADLIAGVTVALVALPLSLAIAIASGAEPATGITTAIVAGFLISALGGSRVQIGGPTGAFIVVVFGVIAEHGYDGLLTATLMAGVILLIAGYLRAGRLIAIVPEAVVNGFTIGIAIIIATSQFKDFLGLEIAEMPAEFLHKMAALWEARATLNPFAVAAALVAMVLIVALRRAFPRFPGLIVAVAASSVLAAVLAWPVDTIGSRFGALPSGLPMPGWPDLSLGQMIEVLPSAFVIAFLAGVESLLSAMVADRMIGGHHRPNAELTAQGAANIASALFGGLPATGAIARTATNVRAGGKTPVAGIVHALAVLLIMALANMSEPDKWAAHMRARPGDRALLLLTLVLTVLADLTVAIGVGVAVGLALRLAERPGTKSDLTPPDR